ncbi:hypothetical protein AAG570_011364 [Ranatra chinensis]|uniref:Ribosome production factor 2 homolog n=1 Tax=Ranatra chinensis TaxID=642074 RepID=A0ABD0YKQ2_9HEMI
MSYVYTKCLCKKYSPILSYRKPTSHKGKKAIINREPKLIENKKQTLFLLGRNSSEVVSKCMKDLYHLKKPDASMLSRKNDITPFDDVSPIEIFSKKQDASLFVFGSNSKKRPNNLIIGRMYDHNLLDMFEFGIENYKGLLDFHTEKISTGMKPCLLFSGPQFVDDPIFNRVQNLFVDLFQREKVDALRLQGVEHVMHFTTAEEKILLRNYRILLKKSGCSIPRIELEEIGPSVDFKIRRTRLASDDLFKLACKQPKALKARKVKNISRDAFGTKLGRLHVKQHNIARLQTRKMKGLRKTPAEKKLKRDQKKKNAK